jgi:histone H2A
MEDTKPIKKKKSHFFEIYILKVLKQISTDSGLTSNAKQQLNSGLCIIANHISLITFNMLCMTKKKTISDKDIGCALNIILKGELLNNSILEGEKAVKNFKNYKETPTADTNTRQDKADILFPPSLTEKFLRNFGYFKIMVSSNAPIYLAAVLEYLTFEILDLANICCRDDDRVRINIRDLQLTVKTDTELDNLFNSLNISFLGGGVVPYIHSSMFNKPTKKKLKHNENNRTNRRFHCGTVALRNIKKQQKFSNSLIFGKSSFESFVRQIFDENTRDKIKISKEVFLVLQHFIEQYITGIIRNANFLAIHAGRVKITPVDIGLISFFEGKTKNPYIEEDIMYDNSVSQIDTNSNESATVDSSSS